MNIFVSWSGLTILFISLVSLILRVMFRYHVKAYELSYLLSLKVKPLSEVCTSIQKIERNQTVVWAPLNFVAVINSHP